MKIAYVITPDRATDTKIGMAFVPSDFTALDVQRELASRGYPNTVQVRLATSKEIRRELAACAAYVVGIPLMLFACAYLVLSL